MSFTVSHTQKRRLFHFVPDQETFLYWRERYRTVSEKNGLLPTGFTLVMLSAEHIIRSEIVAAKKILLEFVNLVNRSTIDSTNPTKADLPNAIDLLWSAVACTSRKKSEFNERYEKYRNRISTEYNLRNEILFVTVMFVANQGEVALRDPSEHGAWAWLWLTDASHKLARMFLKDNTEPAATELANCVKVTVGKLMLDCSMLKEIYNHQYLVKAFTYFQDMIEREKLAHLTRRIDMEIIPSEQSIVAILNMASCFIGFRQHVKCQALVGQARELLRRSEDVISLRSSLYLTAFSDYVDGINKFESTSPLRSKLNASATALNPDELAQKYQRAKAVLSSSADKLKEHFPSSPLIASVCTMLGIVAANSAVKFDYEVYGHLKDAVHSEKSLQCCSNTLHDLAQTLRYAVLEEDDSEVGRKAWENLLKEVLNLEGRTSTRPKSVDNGQAAMQATAISVEETQGSSIFSSEQSLISHQVQSVDLIPSVDFSFASQLVDFLDCCRTECLDYFTSRLTPSMETHSNIAEVFCRLLIARYYLIRCSVQLAKDQQNTVANLFREHFSLNFYKLGCVTIDQLNMQLSPEHRDKCLAVALSYAFWSLNEAKTLLLAIRQKNNWRLTRFIPDRTVGNPVNKTGQFLRKKLHAFADSLVIKLRSRKWRSAKSMMVCSRLLTTELEPSLKNSPNNWHLILMLDSYLVDVCVDLNETLPDASFHSKQQVQRAKNLLYSNLSFRDSIGSSTSAIALQSLAALNAMKPCRTDDNKPDIFYRPDHRALPLFQESYDAIVSAGLVDTVIHAHVHISTAVAMYKCAIRDLTKPAYALYNAAVLKLRQAARILDLLDPHSALAGDCYALLSVMYFNMMQLDDQEAKAMSCVSHCLSIQLSLLASGVSTSKWAWRAIDVTQQLKNYFHGSEQETKWVQLVNFARSLRINSRHQGEPQLETLILTPAADFNFVPLMAENFVDPIQAWEGRHYLKQTCEAIKGRVYPVNNLPTSTEVLCYSHYLMKLWNHHEEKCDQFKHGCWPTCRLTTVWSDLPRQNDFLRGLNEYTLASMQDKRRILSRLQKNHELILDRCEKAQMLHREYNGK